MERCGNEDGHGFLDGSIAMLQCIEEEPALVQRILCHRKEITKEFVELYLRKKIKKVYFSGQASGIYLGKMLQPFMEKLLHVEVTITNPAYFLHHEEFNVNKIYKPEEMLLMCPAHSGTTTGPIGMAKQCKELGIPIVCTTYDVHSELAKLSDVSIYKMSGPEDSFMETKGHVASLLIFFLCILDTAKASGMISEHDYERYNAYFQELPVRLTTILYDTHIWYERNKDLLTSAVVARYIGFGSYYGVALEGSLKIAEASNVSALAYDMEEFMHTGTTQIEKDSLFFIIRPQGVEAKRMDTLVSWCMDHSEQTVVIANFKYPAKNKLALLSDFLDQEYVSVLEYLIPFQVLAYRMAEERGRSTIHASNDGSSKRLKTHVEE